MTITIEYLTSVAEEWAEKKIAQSDAGEQNSSSFPPPQLTTPLSATAAAAAFADSSVLDKKMKSGGITSTDRRKARLFAGAAVVNRIFIERIAHPLNETAALKPSRRKSAAKVKQIEDPLSAVVHLTAPEITKILDGIVKKEISGKENRSGEKLPRNEKARRSQYLWKLLLRLKNDGLITFTLPVLPPADQSAPRPLAFNALDPLLPPFSLFAIWQKEIADYALNVRGDEKKRFAAAANQKGAHDLHIDGRDLEFRTILVLLAFGGICGAQALRTVALIRATDFNRDGRKIYLRKPTGEVFFDLTLHPIQFLALNYYLRQKESSAKDDTYAGGKMFPFLSEKSGFIDLKNRSAFLLRKINDESGCGPDITAFADSLSDESLLSSLIAGAARWMLQIYPVYVVSILTGRFKASMSLPSAGIVSGSGLGFDAAHSPQLATDFASNSNSHENALTATVANPELFRAEEENEKKLRQKINRAMSAALGNESGKFTLQNVAALASSWRKTVDCELTLDRLKGGAATVRTANLALSCESVLAALESKSTDRYHTAKRWLYAGYSILNRLGDSPCWSITPGDLQNLLPKLKPSATRELNSFFTRVHQIIPKYAHLLDGSVITVPAVVLRSNSTAAASAVSPKDPKQALTKQQIEKIADFLLKLITENRKICGADPRAVLIFLDLCSLGLRKNSALKMSAADFEMYSFREDSIDSILTDMVVEGEKSSAGFRVVPLDLSAHSSSARRVIEFVLRIKARRKPDDLQKPLINLASERNYRRNYRITVDRGAFTDAKQLDKALAKAAERCGVSSGATPHIYRHSSISNSLEEENQLPEMIAKIHGHAELETTFEHYVHTLGSIQANNLSNFLRSPEHRYHFALPDARRLLGVSKQYLYRLFPGSKRKGPKAAEDIAADQSPTMGIRLTRSGNPVYLTAEEIIRAAPSSSARRS